MDSQTPNPTECCKNDSWFKTSAIIIGILIVIGLFGNIYLLLQKPKTTEQVRILPTSIPKQAIVTPTIDPTAGWNTYTSSLLGISFKYPVGWFSHKEQIIGGIPERPNKVYEVVFSYPVDNPSPQDFMDGQKAGIDLVYTPKPDQSFDAQIDQLMTQEWGGEPYKSETFIDGVGAVIINIGDPPRSKYVYFDNNGRYFIGFIVGKNEPYEPYDNIFNQILSTFRFD